jgi:hypothetical protein
MALWYNFDTIKTYGNSKIIMEFEYFAKKITGEEKRGTMNANDKLDLSRMLKQSNVSSKA